MSNRTLVVATVVVSIASVAWAESAGAYYTYNASTGNDVIIVGMVDPPGSPAYGAYVCDDGTYTSIGDADGMTADWDVHALAGNDSLEVIRSARSLYGACAGSWSTLDQNTYWIYLHGDDGDDYVWSTGGTGIAWGHNGNDWVVQYAASGDARGGAGNDDVFGESGSADDLRGETGSDCLQDANNSWSTYDCGADYDYYDDDNTAAGKVSCYEPITCCFC